MDESSRTSRRIRHEIDEPGLRASIVADVNVVTDVNVVRKNAATSSSGGGESTRQVVSIRQGRSARSAPAREEKQER